MKKRMLHQAVAALFATAGFALPAVAGAGLYLADLVHPLSRMPLPSVV